MPRLKTRRNSSSSTWRASQAKTGGRAHAPQSSSALRPSGRTRSRLPRIAAAGDVRERLGATAQGLRDVEVEPRGCEQVVAVVVLILEHAADEGEAVRVHPGRRESDHGVAGLDRRAVDQVGAGDDADARSGEVELALGVDAGQLGGLPADERDTRLAADPRRALDELGDLVEMDLVRGDVVEQHQRLGAAGGDVVDAVRGEVGAAVAQPSARARDDQLRPDAVGRGGEQALGVERMQPGERAEARRAGRLDRCAQALDDRVGRRERDPAAS